MAVLVMAMNNGGQRHFPLTKDKTTIGSARDCDLRIALASVSRRHCEIVLTSEEELVVRDLGSDRGTLVNSTPVEESRLSAGDELAIGSVLFTLVMQSEALGSIEVHTVRTESETV